MSFPQCVLLRVVYGGRKPPLPLPAAGARRGLASRVGWGGMAIGIVASQPLHLSRPFGSDEQGGPCCGWFQHTIPILVRWRLLPSSPLHPMLRELRC
jgi:hypothetical protein